MFFLRLPSNGLFFRITVGRSSTLGLLSDICGWMYVITWNLSFYPQVLDNFARKRYILTRNRPHRINQVSKSIDSPYRISVLSKRNNIIGVTFEYLQINKRIGYRTTMVFNECTLYGWKC